MDRYRRIESMIKTLSLTQTEEIFKIFQKNKCQYTVNNNGVFINLSWVSSDILNEVEQFIKFCLESKQQLDQYEAIYQTLNRKFNETSSIDFEEEEKDEKEEFSEDTEKALFDIKKHPPRVSSSMKFYLFKKKFSKNVIPTISIGMIKDRLMKETYVL